MGRILSEEEERRTRESTQTHGRRVTHIGYDDITGQLRGALDQFSEVKLVAFSAVAGLIGIYILLIGPGDYFFLKRLVKRMHLSWLTFPLVSVAFCVLAFFLSNELRGRQVRVNQVDLVDVVVPKNVIRGTSWASFYSPDTAEMDLSIRVFPQYVNSTDAVLAWQPLPGNGLGGVDAPLPQGLSSGTYGLEMSRSSDESISTNIRSMPTVASSTKSLVTRWAGQIELANYGDLSKDTNSGLLKGELINPLPVPLHDAAVLFGSWFYSIDGEFSSEQRIRIENSLAPKNLVWRLTRRTVVNTRDLTTPWDPANVSDLPRVMEMMMFYGAAGGRRYTKLGNRFQPYIDVTDHLDLGHAVLVGRVDRRAVDISIDGQSADELYDQQLTFIRIVIPVEKRNEPTDDETDTERISSR